MTSASAAAPVCSSVRSAQWWTILPLSMPSSCSSRRDHRGYYTVAIVAPAIASQFKGVKLGQVKQALRNLGFHDVVEAALGADMVAKKESKELAEKGF